MEASADNCAWVKSNGTCCGRQRAPNSRFCSFHVNLVQANQLSLVAAAPEESALELAMANSGKPTTLSGRIMQSQNDPRLLDLKSEVELMKAFEQEMVEEIDDGAPIKIRAPILAMLKEIGEHLDNDEMDRIQSGSAAKAVIAEITSLLDKGAGRMLARRELILLLEKVAKMKGTAWDLHIKNNSGITPKQVVRIMTRMFEIVRKYCDTRQANLILHALQAEVLGEEPRLQQLGSGTAPEPMGDESLFDLMNGKS